MKILKTIRTSRSKQLLNPFALPRILFITKLCTGIAKAYFRDEFTHILHNTQHQKYTEYKSFILTLEQLFGLGQEECKGAESREETTTAPNFCSRRFLAHGILTIFWLKVSKFTSFTLRKADCFH